MAFDLQARLAERQAQGLYRRRPLLEAPIVGAWGVVRRIWSLAMAGLTTRWNKPWRPSPGDRVR